METSDLKSRSEYINRVLDLGTLRDTSTPNLRLLSLLSISMLVNQVTPSRDLTDTLESVQGIRETRGLLSTHSPFLV